MSRFDNDNRDHRDDLDRAVAEVLSEPLDDRQVEEAAARVWRKLAAATPDGIATFHAASATPATPATPATAAPAGQPIPGCGDFGHLIPAYLDGSLAPARALLFEDHSRDCLPCRRALHAARQDRAGRAAVPLHEVVEDGGRRAADGDRGGRAPLALRSQRALPWARRLPGGSPWLAAAALLLVGLGLGLALYRALGMGASGGARMARVETVDGRLYRIAGASSVAVAAGDAVREGEQVRTAKDSRAVLRMSDGSQIEMAARAGLSLAAGRGGNTIELERGRIIVQAARQRPRHLYVATDDCLVSVTGTIFAVNHGTRGSRVSVVEGEVHVKTLLLGAAANVPAVLVLHPGDQATTRPNVAAVPVRQEVAWSRDASRYDALLAELGAAGRAIDSQVARPAVRTSSRLLDLVPAGSLVYLALPNLSANLLQTQQLLEQRLAESPVLQQWWSATLGSPANEQLFHDLVQQVGDVGQDLGSEVVIAAGSATGSAAGSAAGAAGSGACSGPPVVLAEALREEPLRATLRQEVAAVNRRAGKTAMVLLDQVPAAGPAADATGTGGSHPLLVWVGQGLLVASPSPSQIAAVAANLRPGAANPFTGSSFHARLVQAYADGAGWLFGADLQRLVAGHRAAAPSRVAEAMGLFDLEHFVLEHHDGAAPTPTAVAASAETRAALTFSQQRRGIAAWLAAPAPMGSLGFFSADANLVAAFVVKSPVDLLDELLSLSPGFAAELAKTEAEHGFNLRDDFAAPLGGEIALGLDGPLLPSPSWQLVAEVYDPVRLQQTFARTVQQVDAAQLAAGKPGVALQQEQDGGRTYYAIVSSGPQLEVHYLFADGYLVAAPTRAQLDRALAQRAAGTTLAASPRLRGLLGRDGQVNVSALFYQNLASIAPITGALGAAADASGAAAFTGNAGAGGSGDGTDGTGTVGAAGRQGGLGSLLFGATRGPSLLYAYAESDRIVFAGHSEAGPMGLNLETLAGFGGILGGIERAHGAAMLRTVRTVRRGGH